MTLVRFKRDLMPTFDSLFDNFFDTPVSDLFSDSLNIRQIPAVNIKETETDFIVELAAPGLKKDDFKISLDKDVLTVSSEKEAENKEEKEGYMRREFSYSSFKRSFTLPEKANRESVRANYEHGVLSIVIAKTEQKVETAKLIEIE
ncbi:Hsp20/alpha crystallin family protein [bacterium]|nr:MAG: Hsp20/alpha crystallin family protein [bacterium]